MRRSIVAFFLLAAACGSDRTLAPEDPAFDNVPAAHEGTGICPKKFNARTVLSGHPVDRNENNIICEFFHAQNESVSQIDDNSQAGNGN